MVALDPLRDSGQRVLISAPLAEGRVAEAVRYGGRIAGGAPPSPVFAPAKS